MRWLYLSLAVLGALVPYSQFIPWLAAHGPNAPLLFAEVFSSHAGAFFGLDLSLSTLVLLIFIVHEGAARKMRLLWVPIAATCLLGVSCGLPLFLFMRERSSGFQAP
jgi:hypothetical protein